jgi:sigma-B regulation protein RsbU (phosphoserine phosphatase)
MIFSSIHSHEIEGSMSNSSLPTPGSQLDSTGSHQLQCMEVWNGSMRVENRLQAPSFNAWIYSKPFHGSRNGGDVYFLSLCVGGIVSRVVLGDVAGHGDEVAATSLKLRSAIRRFINYKSQQHLVEQVNTHFAELEQDGRFATAVIATYLSNKHQLTITNAGHPRPLFYQQKKNSWAYLDEQLAASEGMSNLPFGIDSAIRYESFSFQVEAGDLLLLYTDAFVEAANKEGDLLGEAGLLKLVRQAHQNVAIDAIGHEIVRLVSEYLQTESYDDDATLFLICFSGESRLPTVRSKLHGYAEWFRGLWQR